MTCCTVVLPEDIDALVHVPTPGIASDMTRTNWASGLPAVSGSFANNQGDPTSVIVSGDYSAIVGGEGNTIDSSPHAFIGGGEGIVIDPSPWAAVVGGGPNSYGPPFAANGPMITDSPYSAIIGGTGHAIDQSAAVGANIGQAAIVAGLSNHLLGDATASVILGGILGTVEAIGAAVIAGASGTIGPTSDGSVIIGGITNTITGASITSAIVAGENHLISGRLDSAIVGGDHHTVIGGSDSIVGGSFSAIVPVLATATDRNTIVGGGFNTIDGFDAAAIVAGENNTISNTVGGTPGLDAERSAIIGGFGNLIQDSGFCAIVAGTTNVIDDTSRQSGIVAGVNGIISDGFNHFMGGGRNNIIGPSGSSFDEAAIIGGQRASIDAGEAAIAGGSGNTISSTGGRGFIGGGDTSTVGSTGGALIGGLGGTVTVAAPRSVILGGLFSLVGDADSVALCSGIAMAGTPRTFAHGRGAADAVGFRGVPPIAAPLLAAIPPPTGVPGLDAWIASVDAALKTQGLAI